MRKLILKSLCLVLFAFVSVRAATYVVKPDGTGDYATIQAAVDAVSNNDIIELTDGTFTGSDNHGIDYLGKAITIRSQSGDPDTCIIDCEGSSGFKFVNDEVQTSVLEGVTITSGSRGIICGVTGFPPITFPHSGSPTINNCIISYHNATAVLNLNGGGMCCIENSSPQLTNCDFIENSVTSTGISGTANGGGLYCADSSPSLDNCSFIGNSATVVMGTAIGGGMYCNGSIPSLENCDFIENTAENSGGGFGSENSRPTFEYCTFAGNTASMGGAVGSAGAGGIFDYCTFYDNSADIDGGAIYCAQTSIYKLEMTNCTLYGNSAPYGAGIFLHTTTSAALINNTIIAYGLQGEAVACYSASATLTCCDVYGNEGGDYVSCIAGQGTVRHNFSQDPRFCAPVNEDFTINNQSPCHPLSIPCGLVGAHGVGCTGPLTYYVCPDGSGDFTTIQAAIDTALVGDIIELCDATFTGNGNRDLDYKGKAITVRSQNDNPQACIIDCQSSARGVNFISGEGSNSVLQGITITNGNDSPADQAGAAVLIDGSSPTINNCIFSHNQAMSGWGSFGGGICCNGGSPAITECTFNQNQAFDDGGGLANFGSVTLEDCNFVENSTTSNGGGIVDMGSSCTLIRCSFSDNSADYYGGGLAGFGSDCRADYCVLTENSTDVEGGGMYFGNHSEPNLTNCTFNGNWAVNGGGMSNSWSSRSLVTDCNFTENEADYGGGMYNSDDSEPILTSCTFSSNSAEIDGGGFYSSSGDPNVTECTFVENSAGNVGGAMWNGQSNPQVSNCVFLANEGQNGGGGIANVESSPTVVNCSFISNRGLSSTSNAGGLYNILESHPMVTNCLFTNNSAQWGGAVSNIIGSDPTITNCTIVSNFATGSCGGINDYNDSNPDIANCILWDNVPPQISDYVMCAATVNYSDVQGGWATGVGNIDADPCFVGPTPLNMISYWKFDEDSGTTANDYVNGNGGTISGATWTTGKVGPALYFNNDSVTVPHSSNLDITGPFTVEAWIKATGTDNYNMIVDKFSGSSTLSYGFSFYLTNGKLRLSIYSGANGNGGVGGTKELRDDAWHHVVGLWDGSHIMIYIDGEFEAQSSWAYPPGSTTNDLGIGKRLSCYGGCLYFLGTIDEVAVYDIVLVATEIQQYYQNGLAGYSYVGIGNYHLLHNSPCIDAADNTAVPPDTSDLDSDGDMIEQTPWDIDGRPRFVDGDCNDTIIVDMGAYEFGWVYIGDFEGNDCDVDFYDYAIFALAWLTEDGEAQYNPDCDISLPSDDYIDWLDLEVFVDNWLEGT